MSSSLTNPLTWMDAVEAERAAIPLPSVGDLAQSIEAFHQEHGLAITPQEAAGAAARCLADPDGPAPAINVPWERPTTVAQWEAQQATTEVEWVEVNRREDRFLRNSVIGMAFTGAVATVGGLIGVNGFHWGFFLVGLLGGMVGSLMGLVWGLGRNPWNDPRVATGERYRKLTLMDPSDQDLADLEQWLKLPQIATWMARLRQSEVPLLTLDLDELRCRARAQVSALNAQDKRDQFTARMDQGLVALRTQEGLSA